MNYPKEIQTMIKRSAFVLLFSLVACASSPQGTILQEEIAEAPILAKAPSLSETEENRLQSALSQGLSYIESEEGNALFSPLSYALTKGLEERDLDFVGPLTEKTNFVYGSQTKITSLNAVAVFRDVSEDEISRYKQSHVSVFHGSTLDAVNARLSDYFCRGINLKFAVDAYINQIALEDDADQPWATEMRDFDGKGEKRFATKRQSGIDYVENEDSWFLAAKIGYTDLFVAYPKEGYQRNQIRLDGWLDKTAYAKAASASVSIPEFKVDCSYSEGGDDGVGVNLTQASEFSFDHYGVKGRAITISQPTASGPGPERYFVVDRPFYFASAFQGIPLFVGAFCGI